MAAVLACGEGAVLSHAAAAALWGLLRPGGAGATSSHYAGGSRPVPPVTVRHRIPVTTIARTLDDLRGAVPPRLLKRARRQAELAGWRLEGVKPRRTRSELEEEFLRLCRRHRLPSPEVNVKVGRWEVDFLWREERLVVETDSFAYHRGSVAFEDDHERDLDLRAAGFSVLRFTERQLEEEPRRVVADVARALVHLLEPDALDLAKR